MNKKTARRLAVLGTGDTPVVDSALPQPLLDLKKSFHSELIDVKDSVFPDTRAAREICINAYYNSGIEAETNGYDGIYINTVGDYGLSDLRRDCNIPVTGAGEGSIKIALESGKTFSIITIWPPSMRFIYDEVLSNCGAIEKCLSIHHLSSDFDLTTLGDSNNFVERMQSCGLTTMESIRKKCKEALNKDYAETIILGCTCMNPVANILINEGIPMIEPMTTGYLYLERLIEQKFERKIG